MFQFASTIGHSALSVQLQEHVWIVPAFQSLHLIAIAFLFFSTLSVGAATLRGTVTQPALPWIAGAFGWTWGALAVLLVSGLVLIGAEPVRELMNLVFRIKILLVLGAAAVTILLQRRWVAGRGTGTVPGRALAAAGMGLWLAIIFCGRLIAYFGDLTSTA